jgi:hypothetical protein
MAPLAPLAPPFSKNSFLFPKSQILSQNIFFHFCGFVSKMISFISGGTSGAAWPLGTFLAVWLKAFEIERSLVALKTISQTWRK